MVRMMYGRQTRAALRNFPFSAPPFPASLLEAVIDIKEAAARANADAGLIPRQVARAIVRACREVRSGNHADQFPLSSLQGGAGTSFNMNVNEVLAARATEMLRTGKPAHRVIHPIDDVNRSQSTNDVVPSALRIASIRLIHALGKTLGRTERTLRRKAAAFSGIRTLARTHLQDAIPTTLRRTFNAYASTVARGRNRLLGQVRSLKQLNLGGTAIGTSTSAPPRYRLMVYATLRRITGIHLSPAKDLVASTGSQTDFVALSGAVTALALDCSKIANDLRLLASGPAGGLGQLRIRPIQMGLTIMPGKVNPVLLESVNQLYFIVAGNDTSIREAAHAAQLELGVMLPTIADRLLSSLTLLNEVIGKTTTGCLASIKADPARCTGLLEQSSAYAALFAPRLGYDVVARLVEEARRKRLTFRALVLRKGILAASDFEAFVRSNLRREA